MRNFLRRRRWILPSTWGASVHVCRWGHCRALTGAPLETDSQPVSAWRLGRRHPPGRVPLRSCSTEDSVSGGSQGGRACSRGQSAPWGWSTRWLQVWRLGRATPEGLCASSGPLLWPRCGPASLRLNPAALTARTCSWGGSPHHPLLAILHLSRVCSPGNATHEAVKPNFPCGYMMLVFRVMGSCAFPNSYVEVPAPHVSECALAWR